MTYVDLVVEDVLQEAAARRVVAAHAARVTVRRVFGKRGCAFIDSNIHRYAQASRYGRFLVIRDLDALECAPALARQLLPEGEPGGLVLCVAVREVEAWLLADAESLGEYLGVGQFEVPSPEAVLDPKKLLIDCARRSRIRRIREGLVPVGVARVGPLYNSSMLRYVNEHWRVHRAAGRSPSLLRFVQKMAAFG